jgi:hypothetical protein
LVSLRSSFILANAIVVLSAGLAGCQSRLCAPEGLNTSGEVLSATIVEPYTPNGDFIYDPQVVLGSGPTAPCPGNDGLVQGAAVEFRTAGTVDNGTKTCQLITAKTIALPAPITAVSDDTDPLTNAQVSHDQAIIYSAENVSVNGCAGAYAFALISGDATGGIFSTPVAGTRPPAVLYRLFLPSTSACQLCFDTFVVQLTQGT